MELAGAYGALATGGRLLEPHIIKSVRTSSGRVIYQRPPERRKIVAALQHIGALNDMLNAVLVSGTGKRAALATHPAGGKTGTTQDFRDAWFVGYTAHYVGGVWVGNDDRRPMNNVMGGGLPSKLWHEVMTVAHEGTTPTALPGTMSAPLASTGAAPVDEVERLLQRTLKGQTRRPQQPGDALRSAGSDY